MTKIDDQDLSKVTGGALDLSIANPRQQGGELSRRASAGRTGSGGGPSQPGVVENAAGNAPASGPVDLAPES